MLYVDYLNLKIQNKKKGSHTIKLTGRKYFQKYIYYLEYTKNSQNSTIKKTNNPPKQEH